MKILNISYILPLDGLNRENDIVLRVQDHLRVKYDYNFKIAKALPYVSKVLGKVKPKWKIYRKYIQNELYQVQGYDTLVFPWITLPTSNFWINYLLLPINFIYYKSVTEKKIIRFALNSELILAQNNIPDAIVSYLIAKKLGKPYILNIRGDFNPLIFKLPFLSRIYKNCLTIITHSPQIYKKIKKTKDIKLIPHPVESTFFHNNKSKKNSPITLISVCRLLKLKHLDWVLDSLYEIKCNNYKFLYHIVGDGPEMDLLKKRTKDLNLMNEVVFHGYLNHTETSELLYKSHIFIMPSFPETLGRSFLEAAASNCLIVGHKNTGVDGLFEHKKSAIFVKKKTILYELYEIFNNYTENYIQNYIFNSRKIVDKLTWDNIGRYYYDLYKQP